MSHRIKVLDIELSYPLANIEGLDGYAELEGLVRMHGKLIGKVQVPIVGDYCPAKTVVDAILEQHSQRIARHFLLNNLATPSQGNQWCINNLLNVAQPTYSLPLPLVTVAVCTRDRPADLAMCLEALKSLNYSNLDILVVDNAPSNDATEQLIQTTYPNVRYVCEPRPGLSWARNRAIVEARGEIIAYTDDDVVVDPGWITNLVNVFATNSKVMVVTGYVAAYELETDAQIIFEQAYRFGRGFESKWVQVNDRGSRKTVTQYGATANYGTGANMAYRRSLFERIGYFDPALGAGTATTGGEDLEMFFRVLHEGYTLVYEPNALVRHRHRHDYAQLKKQVTNNGIGYYSYLVRSALTYPQDKFSFVQLGLQLLLGNIYQLLLSFVRPSPRRQRDLTLAELRGSFIGLCRYQKAHQTAMQLANTLDSLTPTILIKKPESQVCK